MLIHRGKQRCRQTPAPGMVIQVDGSYVGTAAGADPLRQGQQTIPTLDGMSEAFE
jgi:hypothetical protein